jgi:hypothetical protein
VASLHLEHNAHHPPEETLGSGLIRFRACPVHLLQHKYEKNHARVREALTGGHMDTTTLLLIVIVLLVLFGGGYYGRRRWF